MLSRELGMLNNTALESKYHRLYDLYVIFILDNATL